MYDRARSSTERFLTRRTSRRHEIAHHGYFHERAKTPEDEAQDFDRATAALKRVTGREPAGYRSPAAGLMPSTLDCLIERNFVYDSSMMGNDFSPYYCRVGDQAPADGPFIVLKVTPRAIACRIDALPVPGGFARGRRTHRAAVHAILRAGRSVPRLRP